MRQIERTWVSMSYYSIQIKPFGKQKEKYIFIESREYSISLGQKSDRRVQNKSIIFQGEKGSIIRGEVKGVCDRLGETRFGYQIKESCFSEKKMRTVTPRYCNKKSFLLCYNP